MASRYELGYRVWPVLVDAALRSSKMTYGELAAALGYKNARQTRAALRPIHDYCIEKGLPPLTALVVNQETGLPGRGFVAWHGDFAETLRSVFGFPWGDQPHPFASLAPVSTSMPIVTASGTDTSYEVPDQQVQINGRGPYQSEFRKGLKKAYSNCCALCDTRHNAMLVASHIVPWAADRKNRLNPRNGILLCRLHDAAYECGLIVIAEDLSVTVKVVTDTLGADLIAALERTALTVRMPKRGFAPEAKFPAWRSMPRSNRDDA